MKREMDTVPLPGVDDFARRQETLAQARALENAGDQAGAERGFREVLDATRGSGHVVAWTALANLTGLFMRQGRESECLLLTRRLVDGAAALEPFRGAWARQALCMALANIEDWARLSQELARFEAAVPGCPPPHSVVFGRSVQALRATVALHHGSLDEAHAAHETLLASLDESTAPNTRRFVHLIGAEVALRGRRLPDALASARLARPFAASPMEAVSGVVVEAECLLELDGADAARAVVRGVLDEIDASPTAERTPAHLVKAGPALGELVAERCGDDVLARRTYDLAGAAVVRRAVEIERALTDLPELADAHPDDDASLAAFRARFRDEMARYLDGVARLLVERSGAEAFLRPQHDGFVRICAWCLRVDRRDGTWLPVGHLFADGAQSRVTHGICGSCAAIIRAGGAK